VFSRTVDPEKSFILGLDSLYDQVASIPLVFEVQLSDSEGNDLT